MAIPGHEVDGHDFISNAIENGAAAVVGERELEGLSVPYLRVEHTRQSLTWLAAAFYDWPGRKMSAEWQELIKPIISTGAAIIHPELPKTKKTARYI